MEMSRPFLLSLPCSATGWTLPQEHGPGFIIRVDPEELKLEAASRTRDIIFRAQ